MYMQKLATLALLVIGSTLAEQRPTIRRRILKETNHDPDLVAEVKMNGGTTVQYFFDGNFITVTGLALPGAKEEADEAAATVRRFGATKSFEELTGLVAPEALVQAESLMTKNATMNTYSTDSESPPPEENEGFEEGADVFQEKEDGDGDGKNRRLNLFNYCDIWYYLTGNNYLQKYTNKIGAEITSYSGCLSVTIDYYSGGYWYNTGYSQMACPGYTAFVVTQSAYYGYYRARTYNGYADGYHFKGCWN